MPPSHPHPQPRLFRQRILDENVKAWPKLRGRPQVPSELGPSEHYKKKPPGPNSEGHGQTPMCVDSSSGLPGHGGEMLSSEGRFPGSASLALAPLKGRPHTAPSPSALRELESQLEKARTGRGSGAGCRPAVLPRAAEGRRQATCRELQGQPTGNLAALMAGWTLAQWAEGAQDQCKRLPALPQGSLSI